VICIIEFSSAMGGDASAVGSSHSYRFITSNTEAAAASTVKTT